jgi:hypothetical protein
MEHESFESEETAALMNKHFVNIKVSGDAAGSWQELGWGMRSMPVTKGIVWT